MNTFQGELIPGNWEFYEPEKEQYAEGEVVGFAHTVARAEIEEILVWTQGAIVGFGPNAYKNYLDKQNGGQKTEVASPAPLAPPELPAQDFLPEEKEPNGERKNVKERKKERYEPNRHRYHGKSFFR